MMGSSMAVPRFDQKAIGPNKCAQGSQLDEILRIASGPRQPESSPHLRKTAQAHVNMCVCICACDRQEGAPRHHLVA